MKVNMLWNRVSSIVSADSLSLSTSGIVPPIAHSILGAEDSTIWTEKRVHRPILANMPHLAASLGIGIDSVWSSVTTLETSLWN